MIIVTDLTSYYYNNEQMTNCLNQPEGETVHWSSISLGLQLFKIDERYVDMVKSYIADGFPTHMQK